MLHVSPDARWTLETLTRFPIAVRREYHVVALDLGMQNRLTKSHAGRTYKSLHLLLVQFTLDKFVEETFVGRGEKMTLHNKDGG